MTGTRSFNHLRSPLSLGFLFLYFPATIFSAVFGMSSSLSVHVKTSRSIGESGRSRYSCTFIIHTAFFSPSSAPKVFFFGDLKRFSNPISLFHSQTHRLSGKPKLSIRLGGYFFFSPRAQVCSYAYVARISVDFATVSDILSSSTGLRERRSTTTMKCIKKDRRLLGRVHSSEKKWRPHLGRIFRVRVYNDEPPSSASSDVGTVR